MAELTAQRRNNVIGFYLSERLCFIERVADYAEREEQLQNGAQRLITAILVGELGNEPVNSLSEFRSWFPMETLSAIGFVSGVEVGYSWIEIRDAQGELIRRLHGTSWIPSFDTGDNLLGKHMGDAESGIGPFLRGLRLFQRRTGGD